MCWKIKQRIKDFNHEDFLSILFGAVVDKIKNENDDIKFWSLRITKTILIESTYDFSLKNLPKNSFIQN